MDCCVLALLVSRPAQKAEGLGTQSRQGAGLEEGRELREHTYTHKLCAVQGRTSWNEASWRSAMSGSPVAL